MSMIETIVENVAPGLHKKVSDHFEDRRMQKSIEARVVEILAENDYKDYSLTWGQSDWKGELKMYPVKFTYDLENMKLAPTGSALAVVPIYINDTDHDSKTVQLILVDRALRTARRIYNSGQSGIHYEGSLRVKPLVVGPDSKFDVINIVYQVTRLPALSEYKTWEPYSRLLRTGTTAETEICFMNVPK